MNKTMSITADKSNSADLSLMNKVCGVCGDKALGYNFNALTCESCKAFFRRNALTTKEFRCPFNEQCDITIVTRRFCQKCRLEKCFNIGMKKEYIMSEEDKVLKRKKIEQNRAKKKFAVNDEHINSKSKNIYAKDESNDSIKANEVHEGSNNVSVIMNAKIDVSNDDSMTQSVHYGGSDIGSNVASPVSGVQEAPLLTELINNGKTPCNSHFHNQNFTSEPNLPVTDVTRDVLQDVQRIPIEPNSIESILCEAIKLEFEAYTSLASSSRELNDAERAKLHELIVANKALLQPLDDDIDSLIADDCRFKADSNPRSATDPVLLDIINLTAIAIRRLIKMAKKINAFKNMCQEDQVALLKGGCTEMMILRSAMTYDHTKEAWKIPHSQESMSRIKVEVLKQAKGNIYQEFERFIRTFDPRWRMDENIILILCAITLFTPDRPRVVHHDVIKLEQNSYYYLLRRYLESIYQGCEARSTFLKLIQKISELHKLNDEVISVYLDVNPSNVEPLLIEIFDLKPH